MTFKADLENSNQASHLCGGAGAGCQKCNILKSSSRGCFNKLGCQELFRLLSAKTFIKMTLTSRVIRINIIFLEPEKIRKIKIMIPVIFYDGWSQIKLNQPRSIICGQTEFPSDQIENCHLEIVNKPLGGALGAVTGQVLVKGRGRR